MVVPSDGLFWPQTLFYWDKKRVDAFKQYCAGAVGQERRSHKVHYSFLTSLSSEQAHSPHPDVMAMQIYFHSCVILSKVGQ